MTSRQYFTRINDENVQAFLDAKREVADYIRNLIILDFQGKLVNTESVATKLKEEYQALRNQKLIVDIEGSKLDNQIKSRTLTYQTTFGSNPSFAGRKAINDGFRKSDPRDEEIPEQQSPYDEKNNRIQCTECGILFPLPTLYDQVNKWIDHMRERHKRPLNEFEQQIIADVIKEKYKHD